MNDQIASERSTFQQAYKAYVDAGAALHKALCSNARERIPALQTQLDSAAEIYERARCSYVAAVMADIDRKIMH